VEVSFLVNGTAIILLGARCQLRLPRVDEAGVVANYFVENRDHLSRTSSQLGDEFYQESFWRDRIRVYQEEFRSGSSARFFVFSNDNDRVIGAASLTDIRRGPLHGCFLGYNIAASSQNLGYATEALKLLIEFAFDQLNIHRIMSNYLPDNLASAKVMTKLGFEIEGYARDYLRLGGEWRDHVLSSLINRNWKEVDRIT
jgi:ribosomal-protein-alanine N-acetyltransferase